MSFFLGLAILYIVLLTLIFIFQRNLMYFPGGPRPALEFQADPEIITVHPDKGHYLDGFYWPAADGQPTIVFFHGNGQAYQYWVDKLAHYYKEGYGVLFTDYRGYGGQPGIPTEEGLYRDASAFIEGLLIEHAIQPEDMIFYGESLGTGVAIEMATIYEPKALILESPYSATVDIAQNRYWMFPATILMKDQFLSREKIRKMTMPKFFIHGDKDMIIPIRFGKKLYQYAPEPKQFKIVQGSGHNNLYDHGAALHILDFLRTLDADKKEQ